MKTKSWTIFQLNIPEQVRAKLQKMCISNLLHYKRDITQINLIKDDKKWQHQNMIQPSWKQIHINF